MPLETLQDLLEEAEGGVWYRPVHIESRSLQSLAKRSGFAYFHIEGKNIARKEQLLNHVATALHFPSDFGNNWDALEECLSDMEWVDAQGYLIYYEHIDGFHDAHPDQFETFLEILRDAVASWKEDQTAMVVLLSGSKAPKGIRRLKETASD